MIPSSTASGVANTFISAPVFTPGSSSAIVSPAERRVQVCRPHTETDELTSVEANKDHRGKQRWSEILRCSPKVEPSVMRVVEARKGGKNSYAKEWGLLFTFHNSFPAF